MRSPSAALDLADAEREWDFLCLKMSESPMVGGAGRSRKEERIG